MKREPFAWFLLFLSLVPGPWLLTTVEASPVLVGAAKLDLTPPVKTPLAGYSRRRGRPSTGVLDPPFVRAVVMQDRDTTVALASCDLLVIDEQLFDAVKTRLEASRAPKSMAILIAATHTHSGPGAYGQKFLEKISMGHFDQTVFDFLVGRIAQAIVTAAERLEPVTVRCATTMTQGLVVNRMSPGGIVDAELSALAFDDAHHHPVAILVNFSAHPTTLGAWNRRLSADYPGALTKAIEGDAAGTVCVFIAGAVGDQGPVKHGEGLEPPQWLGEQLAARVKELLERARPESPSRIQAMQRTVMLSPAQLRLGPFRVPSWFGRLLVDDDASVSVAAAGRALFVGLPCDFSAELGLELKRHARAAGYQPFLVGFANDYIGYCLPESLYRTNSYEASMAFNGPTTGPALVKELEQMMDQLSDSVTGGQ